MKKLLTLIVAFILVAGIATSCTEENIQPQGNGGATQQQKP